MYLKKIFNWKLVIFYILAFILSEYTEYSLVWEPVGHHYSWEAVETLFYRLIFVDRTRREYLSLCSQFIGLVEIDFVGPCT